MIELAAAQHRRSTALAAEQPGCHVTRRCPPESCAAQAYKYWLQGEHPFLFLANNDVLVPTGVLTKLMDGMRDDGAGNDVPSRVLCSHVSWAA